MFLPLIVRGEPIGVLILGTAGKPRAFSPSEIILYSALANQSALAIANARLYKEVQDYADNLEEQVVLRTEELNKTNLALQDEITGHKKTESLLIEAKEEAEKANRIKSSFLANMSHEIRTPMNAIIGMSNLALKTELDNKQQNYIKKVHYSAENLLRILNDILDLSKIESGSLELENIDFNLKEVIDNLVNIVGQKAHDKSVKLSVSIDKAVPRKLIGDSLRLSQVLINLAGNSVKFCTAGDRITLRVSQKSLANGQTTLQFDVEDTGLGIARDQQQDLFRAFSQADAAITRTHGGTGLGLSISKQIVEMMGGEIWFESESGVGTTFSFTVHLGAQVDMVTHEVMAEADAGIQSMDRAIASLQGARLLLVEDNEINQEILLELLTIHDIAVETANNGQEALEALEKASFDGVLMDCQMPIMDGYEATRQIRKQEKYKDLPVIALTASAMSSDREKVLEAG